MEQNDFLALSEKEQDEWSNGYDELTDLPVSYDPRLERARMGPFLPQYQIDPAHLTPVKKQFSSNCWIFAASCSLESYLLKHGLVASASDIYADYSEAHMTYDMFDIDHLGAKKNSRGIVPRPSSTAVGKHRFGGNKLYAAAYFARGGAAVPEITDPNPPSLTADPIARTPEVGLKKEKRFYVSGLTFLNDPMGMPPCANFIDNVKDHVLSDASVSVSLLWHRSFMNKYTSPSGKEIRAYYSPKPIPPTIHSGRHAVAIIGWDDAYSKANFSSTYRPATDGAFLCRNSHGISANWDGNFWLSYEDANMKNCSCVTDVIEDCWSHPNTVYSKAAFGMTKNRNPGSTLADPVTFSVSYTAREADETLTHIGLFNIAPCVADVVLKIGTTTTKVISGTDLYYAGYHAVPVSSPCTIGARGTAFTIECTYTAYPYGTASAPYEAHDSSGTPSHDPFQNISVTAGDCYINGVDVTTLGRYHGNVALYAITKNTGALGSEIEAARNAAALPAATDARIDCLPNKSGNQPLEWRLEPAEAAVYMPTSPFVLRNVKIYKAGSSIGLINTLNTAAASGYVTVVVGTGDFAMKRAFAFDLPAFSDNTLSCAKSAVTDCNMITLSGSFPIPGAKVKVKANNSLEQTVTVDSAGSWSATDYRLYDGAWKDTYAGTNVAITVTDDSGTVLATGSASQTLTRPFSEDPSTATIVLVILSPIAFLATLGFLISKYCNTGKIATLICNGFRCTGSSQGHRYLRLENLEMEADARFDNAYSIHEVHKKLKFDALSDAFTAGGDVGGLVTTISKGGSVTNCSVEITGDAKGENLGGLFFTGEDVTVSDCVITGDVTNAASYGAVAHTLAGSSTVSNVTVTGTAQGETIAGIAVNLSGSVTNANISIVASSTKNAAGVAVNSSANISAVSVEGAFSAMDGYASGAVVTGTKGTVSDVRVSAAIDGKNGAAGIMVTQGSSVNVKHCYVAGTIGSSTGKAAGISGGISGSASSVSRCVCACSKISGASAARISFAASEASAAYAGIVCNVAPASSGEALKTAFELLDKATYGGMGWDMANTWAFDAKKLFPYLKGALLLYDYPFPNPFPTQSGRYEFQTGIPIAFWGAQNSRATKLKWALSSNQGLIETGLPEYLLNQDEFYLQLCLAGTAQASFQLSIISVLDSNDYSISFPITII